MLLFFFVVFCLFVLFFFSWFLLLLLLLFSSLFFSNKKNPFFHRKYGRKLCKKIDKIGSLDAGIEQIPLVETFCDFHNIVTEHK